MPEIIRDEPLTPEQQSVLDTVSRLVVGSGLGRRYAQTVRRMIQDHGQSLEDPEMQAVEPPKSWVLTEDADPAEAIAGEQQALVAEVPFAFGAKSLLYGEEAQISLLKVDAATGSELPDTRLTIAHLSRTDQQPRLQFDFTDDDFQLAVSQLRAQHQAGLEYVPDGKSGELDWLFG